MHSSVDGHLGCFYVLTVVNSAAMNIGVHVSFTIVVCSGYMHSSGIILSFVVHSLSMSTLCNPMDCSTFGSSVLH